MIKNGMTSLEQAFNTMVRLLTAHVAWQEEQLDKAARDIAERPTREQLDEARKQRDDAQHATLRSTDEVHMLRRHVGELEKQLEEALKATSKRRPRQRLVPTGGRRAMSA